MVAMALYFVTMDVEELADPRLPVHRLANIVREAILPTVEALIPLGEQEMLVTGGYLVGEGQMVFASEADSEEEVRKMLEDLLSSGVATAKVRRMRPSGRCTPWKRSPRDRTKKKDRGDSKLRPGRTPDTRVLYLAFNLRGKHRQGRRYPYIPGTS
jgi:hypothetical protein